MSDLLKAACQEWLVQYTLNLVCSLFWYASICPANLVLFRIGNIEHKMELYMHLYNYIHHKMLVNFKSLANCSFNMASTKFNSNTTLFHVPLLWCIIKTTHVFGKTLIVHIPKDHFNYQPPLHIKP